MLTLLVCENTMSEQQVRPSVAQRIIIKFLANEGVSATEILGRLRAQFGENTLSRTQVFDWHKKFRDGRSTVENEAHRRRPRTSVTDDHIRTVKDLIAEDRRINVREIASEVGISYGSVETIIRDHLNLSKVSARWVPRLLTDQQKQIRKEVCERHLVRHSQEGDDFLTRIVTCDETWVHHYTPESKQASKEWRKKKEAPPVKARTRLSAGKVMMTIFWDMQGVLLIDFLHGQRTINAAYYCQLLDEVKKAYRSKRRQKSVRRVVLLHDNARPHTANLTREKLAKMHWETLEHPPYSPDLSPCDFFLFGPLKEELGGRRFATNEEVEAFVRDWLLTRPRSFYSDGMKKLPIRWEKCVAKSGEYVEK